MSISFTFVSYTTTSLHRYNSNINKSSGKTIYIPLPVFEGIGGRQKAVIPRFSHSLGHTTQILVISCLVLISVSIYLKVFDII